MARSYSDFAAEQRYGGSYDFLTGKASRPAAPSFEETSRKRVGGSFRRGRPSGREAPPEGLEKIFQGLRTGASSKVYVAVRVDEDRVLEALGVAAPDARSSGTSQLARRVARQKLREEVAARALWQEALAREQAKAADKQAERARMTPQDLSLIHI